jgi:hypothetical protein
VKPENMIGPAEARKFASVQEKQEWEQCEYARKLAAKEAERLQLIKDIGTFFDVADTDGNGCLSFEELETVLRNEEMQPIIKKLRIPAVWSAKELYDYLSGHGSQSSVDNVLHMAHPGPHMVTANRLVDACSRWHGDYERSVALALARRAPEGGFSGVLGDGV